MLSPKEAYDKLIQENKLGFDDPRITWRPHRWYWFNLGNGKHCLADCAWRSNPTLHEQYIKPNAV